MATLATWKQEDWIAFQMLREASQLNIYERIYCRTGTI
jgi:hypothetical protein